MKTVSAILYAVAMTALLCMPYVSWGQDKRDGVALDGGTVVDGRRLDGVVLGALTYLVEEDFEGSGTPAGWTNTGTPEYDNTAHSTLTGQALELDSADQAYTTYTANSTIWAACKMEVPTAAIPSSTASFWGIRSSAGGAHALLRIGVGGSGKVALFCAGADTTASSTFTISGNTLYYVWIKYVNAGTCELYISTTPTKPSMSTDSATQFSTSATDDTSGDAARVDFRGGLFSPAVYYDEVFVSTTELSNPWGD